MNGVRRNAWVLLGALVLAIFALLLLNALFGASEVSGPLSEPSREAPAARRGASSSGLPRPTPDSPYTPPATARGGSPLDAFRASAQEIATAGRDRLQGQYSSEPVDPGWAPSKEQVLSRLSTSPQIEALDAKPTSFSARCRTSTCRVVADFSNRRAAEDWFTLYTLSAGVELPRVSVLTLPAPDGGVRLELYGTGRH